jgi:threonine dehydratase
MTNLTLEIQRAAARIAPHVRETPLERSIFLSRQSGAEVFLKLENHQITGSFKARGALNKLSALDASARQTGVVTASSGNHGAAVAYGSSVLGIDAEVFVPEVAAQTKIDLVRSYGARVEIAGEDCVQTEAHARAHAAETGRAYVPPYNDPHVMAGQGTVAVEIASQLPDLDAVFVSLGGGGLIGGMGTYLESALDRSVEVVAVSPERSPAMHRCLEAGTIIDVACHDTLSDGTAGGVEPGSITFEVCQRVIDRSLLVEEEPIAEAMRQVMTHHRMMLEGAAGAAVAGFLQVAPQYAGKRVVIVLCGANIGLDKLRKVLG